MFGTNIENGVSNLNNDLNHEVVDLIDADEVLEHGLELIETLDTELDICVKLIDCGNVSENTHFSEPDLEVDLIDFRDSSKPEHKLANFSKFETDIIDFSNTELIDCENVSENTHFSEPYLELDLIDSANFSKFENKIIDFSNTEPKFDYTLKPKETEFEMPPGIYIEDSKINTGNGIFTENFFKPFSELGRVKVARHNLGMKKVCIYFVFFTLYLFSGAGAIEFKQRIETRWVEERAKTSSSSQTWLIPQPRSNSWGDANSIIK